MGSTGTKTTAPWTSAVRAQAIAAFDAAHAGLTLAPVVVVIAALDERDALGGVLDAIPHRACGLETARIVIDDGSTDGTADVAVRHGALLARLERNCGHGIALRVGYELANTYGARYIVTLDADGQWDPTELEGVLEPVVAGDADFVIGSRVLGGAETDNRFRHAGVHVFAALVRLLCGVRVTDTSSGFRAMRAEVPMRVRQEQVQYQTSELLIGAIAQGYRIAERPVVMRKRTAGESKKGNDLLYGLRYARVIVRTWWRDRPAT